MRLLADDGVIFAQADDREGHYLKVIMDEVLGRSNFIATFLWRKVDSPNDNKVPVTPDHVLIFAYARDTTMAKLRQKPDPSLIEAYRGPDEEGRYFRDRLLKKNGKNSLRSDRPTMWFPIKNPDGTDI
ncbi:DNA methyltransferase [Erythrobacter sp. T5W1-R]|uniref:DNA methyltransferase n=1 Tax=Erythrobacter sp. T5W1-R TaxID=3101752 RepID=UPI002AFDF02B|nr:DNA methyltransferase [Erythrobacter sp. T5W1-R]MEA1619413.1 DNA methyltransferase [Erythrobacter sp. T5W1-R]